MNTQTKVRHRKKISIRKALSRDWQLYAMLILPIAFYIIFMYGPMYGVIIAFKDYNIFAGIAKSEWVGFDVFREIFKMPEFYRALRNTLTLNLLGLILGFPAPILLAVMLNEVRNSAFKRVSQSILYLPHFLSWVIIGGLATQIFAPQGIINYIIKSFGSGEVEFLSNKPLWIAVYQIVGIWHGMGWNAIIYLAAITGISGDIYEAAELDGCSRVKMIYKITIPSIMPTIVIMLVINLGKIISIAFDPPYVLGNSLVEDVSDVISTFVYRVGLKSADYSTATAVGLFQSIVSTVLIIVSNIVAKALGEEGLW